MRKSIWLGALAVLSATGSAFMIDDAQILIDRALNSPTVTVKYSGASAAMAEIRLNGVSIGTRELNASNKKGETNFTLDLSTLRDGDNEIEVRLYDKAGKLVGVEKSTITTDSGARGPVYVMAPKVGDTVTGTVDIRVGFGQEFANKYVSFFVDNQFRSMTNSAPFAYTWDTTKDGNGWHEVEIWVVDQEGATYKTRKVKVFVNNAGGRTERPPVASGAKPVTAPLKAVPTTSATIRPNPATGAAVSAATTAVPGILGSAIVANSPKTTPQTGLKPVTVASEGVAMGSRTMTPGLSGVRTTPAGARPTTPKGGVIEIRPNVGAAVATTTSVSTTARTTITKGVRLPEMGSYAIYVNAKPVNFDVAPRVTNGVPLTPFRHLFEAAGGEVKWDNVQKLVAAAKAGQEVYIKIGDKMARVNKLDVELEMAPFIERGRTIVPLSFVSDHLNVDVEFDPATGHVLIKTKN